MAQKDHHTVYGMWMSDCKRSRHGQHGAIVAVTDEAR